MLQWLQNIRIKLLYLYGGAVERAVSESEYEFTLKVSDLIDAGYPLDLQPKFESWIARDLPSNSSEIKYTYEPSEYIEDETHIILITRVERESNASSALAAFEEGIESYKEGVTKEDSRYIYKGNLQKWSDNAYVAFTLDEPSDSITGCILSFQKNNLVYSIITRWLVFEEVEDIEDVLYPLLTKAEKWST